MVFKDGELPVNDAGKWTRAEFEPDEDTLLRDVAFNRHSRNFAPGGANIVSPSAQARNNVGLDGVKVRLVQGLPPEADVARIIWKGLNATKGIDVGQEPDVNDEEWQDMFRGGLQTAMEAFVLVFEVSGVSRTCTHQLVRSRRAGFHQQSQRAGSYTEPSGIIAGKHKDHDSKSIEQWPNAQGDGYGPNVRVPESVWRAMGMAPRHFSWGGDGKGTSGRDAELAHAWQAALLWSRKAYRLALESDVSYQDARYILPEGTENYIICEYTLREFLNVYNYRACSMFSWEIVHVVRVMGELLVQQSPWIKGTGAEPKISCERTSAPQGVRGPNGSVVEHQCTFQGWERVEGQCGFPWALEDNRTFKPKTNI